MHSVVGVVFVAMVSTARSLLHICMGKFFGVQRRSSGAQSERGAMCRNSDSHGAGARRVSCRNSPEIVQSAPRSAAQARARVQNFACFRVRTLFCSHGDASTELIF